MTELMSYFIAIELAVVIAFAAAIKGWLEAMSIMMVAINENVKRNRALSKSELDKLPYAD